MEQNPSNGFQPAEVLEFDTIEDLDALVSPFRIRLLSCFRNPGTIKEAAATLGVGATRLYHHIHRLVDHGFLVEVGERPAGKTVERLYSVAADTVRPSSVFLDRYGREGNAELARLIFRTVESEVVAAVEADSSLDLEGSRVALTYTRLFLDEAALTELVATIDRLVAEQKSRPRSGDVEVSFFASVVPLSDGRTHPRRTSA